MTKLCSDYMLAISTVHDALRMSSKASQCLFAWFTSSTVSLRNASPVNCTLVDDNPTYQNFLIS